MKTTKIINNIKNNYDVTENDLNEIKDAIDRINEVTAIIGALTLLNNMPLTESESEETGMDLIRNLVLGFAEHKKVIEWDDEKHTYICRYTKESIHIL